MCWWSASLSQRSLSPGWAAPASGRNSLYYVLITWVYVGCNLWICKIHGSRCAIYGFLVRAEINGLRRNLWITQGRGLPSTDLPVLYPDLTLISLLRINIARQVAVYDWWTILEVSAWYETHVSNNNNFTPATCRDDVFHTTPTPTVCYSVPSIVEVSGGCQSVNIYVCADEGLL